MNCPLLEYGGLGPLLHWAPANGFPLETYRPIFDALAERYRVVAIPPRALWPEIGPPPSEPGSWEMLADGLVQGLVDHGLTDVIAVGHSFGGVASLVAAARHRHRFRALALLDPTILPDATVATFRASKAVGWQLPHPIADRARERRAEFASHAEAFEYWRSKQLFADWSDEALRRYVDGILRPSSNGGYSLSWPPVWEAYYYESIYLDIWDDVARLDRSLPILAVGGADSETFMSEARQRFAEQVPWAEVVVLEDCGHLFPQTAPTRTIEVLQRWLGKVCQGDL